MFGVDLGPMSFELDGWTNEATSARHEQSPRLIWVVEDDFVLGTALVCALEEAGYEAVQLYDVAEIAARRDRPNGVVLDVCLRECDAIDALQVLQAKNIDGPIQILSGSNLKLLEEIRVLGKRRGLDMLPVLSKPCPPDQVVTVVEQALSARSHAVEAIAFPAKAKAPVKDNEPLDLGMVLAAGWVEVWYQPKIALATGAIVGAECLARARHPERGIVPPCDFLRGAKAEDMATLTELVIGQACSDWSDLRETGHAMRLAVNVPGSALTQLPLVKLVRERAPKALDWAGLTLEITEDEALRDIEAAVEVSTQLKIYGVELSIDDFGIGYSSLSRLREIPFGEIKLDRSLVDGCADDAVHGALCRSVIDLAHSFGARAVAEGIERQADAAFLRDLTCDIGQGYLFARPMPKLDLLAMLRRVA